MKYRAEIDGLRAIAVMAVILYHAKISILDHKILKGGYIGVDIFFVISGYLITSIILKELITVGSFSFKNFYIRRLRRILPALLFVMLVSIPFAWIYLIPSSLVDFSKSILYSLGFSSNYYFWITQSVYVHESSLLLPFLHTWSLSVEEQFYILFPVILLGILKFFRRWLITILLIGFTISLLLADWGSRNYATINFYSFPTRGWELLIGSILAYYEIKLGHRSKNKQFNLILPGVGLILIICSILFFHDNTLHPSFYTLIPIMGVCFLIWFSNRDELITKILSSKLLVATGLISYSLYLWHYPIFAFARSVDFISENAFSPEDVFKQLILIVIIFLISTFSYYFIERPARNNKKQVKFILYFIFLSLLILISINLLIVSKKGFKNRMSNLVNNQDTVPLLHPTKFIKCENGIKCEFNLLSQKKIFIVGDSIMASIMSNLKNRVVNKNYSFITKVKLGCVYFPGFNLASRKPGNGNRCDDSYFLDVEQTLKKEENAIIIFGGNFPLYLNDELSKWKFKATGKFNTLQSSFKSSVDELSKKNKIILVYPVPNPAGNISKKLLNKHIKNKNLTEKKLKLKDYITTNYSDYKKNSQLSFKLLDSIKGDNIHRVYPAIVFCNTFIKEKCFSHDDKNTYYQDNSHPSAIGAEMINDQILIAIDKIEASSD